MIESRTTRRFREAYRNLPKEIRQQALRAYRLFEKNPRHPGLRFKKVEGEEDTFSVRIGLGYRALGVMKGSTITWFWIGSHADYDQLT